MVSDPWAKTSGPAADRRRGRPPGARAAACRCCSGSARSSRSPGSWSLPGGELAPDETLEQLDPPPPRRQGRRARARPPRAARDPQRPRTETRCAGSSRRPTSGSSPPTSTRRCRPTRAGTRSTGLPHARLRPRADRARRPGAAAREALLHEHRLRARARRRSRSPSSATSTARRSATTSRRRTCSACSCAGTCSSPTGEPARARARPAGGPAALYRFRSRALEITDQFAVLRPPPTT